MGIIELMVLGIALSMDSFAVSVCKGLKCKTIRIIDLLKMAIVLALCQATLPLVGWCLGTRFESMIVAIDHWIAFVLLLFIGGKMILEGIKNDNTEIAEDGFKLKELFLLGIATSIDAMAVGVTFAFFEVNIVLAILIIFSSTFFFSFLGGAAGKSFGKILKNYAEIIGGLILIAIGIKILIEHLIS